MTPHATDLEERLLAKAHALGASLAGIAAGDVVTDSPSHRGRISTFSGVGSAEWGASTAWAQGSDGSPSGPRPEEPPAAAGGQGGGGGADAPDPDPSVAGLLFPGGSVVVLALAHPPEEPDLDWWGVPGATRGNRLLMDVTAGLTEWLAAEAGMSARDLPYYPDKGGAFLKDSAVLAGLGCIGKNNLLVTPEHGPRVRLRGLAVDAPLAPTGPLWSDPCDGCAEPCRRACPQGAFDTVVYSSVALGTLSLPGRTGCFDRRTCNLQMVEDEAAGSEGIVRFCRRCEVACTAGR